MAAWMRLAASAGAAVVVLAGCTYSTQEPGLFPSPQRTTEVPFPTGDRFPPERTNPKLPVAGERIWVTGGQIPVTVRIAVHAVRRVEGGATVLDWSVTPLSAEGFEVGDTLPGIDLGLERPARGNDDLAISLLEAKSTKVYRPLSHQSRRLSNHCLCTPWWRLAQELRIGETRLLQVSFPSLPGATEFVDVSLATVTPFLHVPVSPIGTAPRASRPTNLARSADLQRPLAQQVNFRNPIRSGDVRRIQVIRVWTAPGRATLEWKLSSVTDRLLEFGPPVAAPTPEGVFLANGSPASGPVLLVPAAKGAKRLTASWVATERNGVAGYECLCTELGMWSAGLRKPGGSVGLVTNYPELPPGTSIVDVELPGFGTFRKVPVTAVENSARRLRAPERAATGLWTYSVEDPPRGWPTADWPTDTPDPAQLAQYRFAVERVADLPGGR